MNPLEIHPGVDYAVADGDHTVRMVVRRARSATRVELLDDLAEHRTYETWETQCS